MRFASRRRVHFTIEQVIVEHVSHARLADPVAYHLVEAETLDAAVDVFLAGTAAAITGQVQKFSGLQAFATARSADAIFTFLVTPGAEVYRRHTRAPVHAPNPAQRVEQSGADSVADARLT